jgi:rhodanese-related sulfurtransferase
MTPERRSTADEMIPPEAFAALAEDPGSALVDVRTRAEWTFTGMPDLSGLGRDVLAVEWVSFPGMAPNPRFYEDVVEQAGGTLPDRLFFICRSGARSLAAARMVAAEAASRGHPARCTNVAEGFEGELDGEGHRGRINGWKAHGLPWRQS